MNPQLLHSTDELRKLLADNPDLPFLVFASDTANDGEYSYTSCSSVKPVLGEFLDCEQNIKENVVFTDRQEFEEEIEDKFSSIKEYTELSDADFFALCKMKAAEYEQYWRKCIILYVGN